MQSRTTRLVAFGATLLLTGAAFSGATSPAGAVGSTTSSLTQELQRASDGGAHIAVSPETGAVTFVGGSGVHPLQASSTGAPSVVARKFIDRYGPMFGVADPSSDLTELSEFNSSSGGKAVKFQQRYRGLPVLAGVIAVQIAADGSVLSTSGEAAPGVEVDIDAAVTAAAAADTARALTAKYDHVAGELLSSSPPELWIYDPSLLGADGPPGPRLVWRVDVRTELGDVDRLVLIDAHSGTVALQFSQREDALNRSVCSNQNVRTTPPTCSAPLLTEGFAPYAGGFETADVNSAYDLSGVTYDFYASLFGRDSVDGLGLPLKSTVLYCSPASAGEACPLKNAFWNGSQMVYGQGYAIADDVVAHELTHGVTQYTSDLLYYAESGAINESMSDVMGELVDISSTASGPDPVADRWKMGEQLPFPGAIRNMKDPAPFGDPDRMTSPLYFGGVSDSHGVHTNSGVNNKAAFLIADGGAFNGQTVVGLGTTKTAYIYYEAETTLLGPGSDYLDLFHILPQACINIIGTAGITADDCAEVTKAVTATEMDKSPTTAGAHLSAPLCDGATVQNSVLLTDDMETNNLNWNATTTPPVPPWAYLVGSSQSGARSMHGADAATAAISTLLGTFSLAVPAGATTFLRFDHSFEMDYDSAHYYDGGVVEYSTNGGSTWADAVALPGPTINGYNGKLDSNFQNPLAGRFAFSGPSPGYETTRISLSSLGGSTVKLRFRLASDNSIDYPGWFIDDVKVYTCGAGSAPTVPAAPTGVVATGANQSVALSWQAPGDGGSAITSYTITPFIGGIAQSPISTSSTGTSFSVPGLVNGTSYTFTVAAANAVGTGPPSAPSNAVTPGTPTGSLVSLVPARLLESRSGLSTIDGLFNGVGVRGAGSVTALTVAGRGGVGGDAAAVVLNVTVTDALAAGFVTVYPCGSERPTASNLNYVAGSTVANAVVVKVGDGGQVCVFTQSPTHLLVDVGGYFSP